MAYVGHTLKQARSCKICKPNCDLFDLLRANRFTRFRRLPGWYGFGDRFYQKDQRFKRELETQRLERRMDRKYG